MKIVSEEIISQWLEENQLFLFDFDGLLVDTEAFHYKAYVKMCAARGFHLDWSFAEYAKIALCSSDGIKKEIYSKFPALYASEPNWKVLYEEKKQAILQLFREEPIPLMPGVESLLKKLQVNSIKHCVVTHSAKELLELICQKNPLLRQIPYWVTREHYVHPKPSPECYNLAIEKYALPGERVIGFEDSWRGLEALCGSKAKPILVCSADVHYIDEAKKLGAQHFVSFG